MTNMAAVLSVHYLSLMASCRLHILTVGPRAHHLGLLLFVSSAIMQSGIPMHDIIALMVIHKPGISSSMSHGCVWIANLL